MTTTFYHVGMLLYVLYKATFTQSDADRGQVIVPSPPHFDILMILASITYCRR